MRLKINTLTALLEINHDRDMMCYDLMLDLH